MMRTLNDYVNQLIALLPVGIVWVIDFIGSKLKALLTVCAGEFLRVDTRHADLINELMPDTTSELIAEWERVAGLPDPCTGQLATLQERINALIAKLSIQGGLSEQFYIDLAAQLGYTVTITVLGANQWRVNAPLQTVTYFRVGESGAGDPLQSSDNNLLECVMNKYKPAHTSVTFNYT